MESARADASERVVESAEIPVAVTPSAGRSAHGPL